MSQYTLTFVVNTFIIINYYYYYCYCYYYYHHYYYYYHYCYYYHYHYWYYYLLLLSSYHHYFFFKKDINYFIHHKCGRKLCNKTVLKNHQAVQCDNCHLWVHIKFNKINLQTYKFLQKSSFAWYCIKCFEDIIPF